MRPRQRIRTCPDALQQSSVSLRARTSRPGSATEGGPAAESMQQGEIASVFENAEGLERLSVPRHEPRLPGLATRFACQDFVQPPEWTRCLARSGLACSRSLQPHAEVQRDRSQYSAIAEVALETLPLRPVSAPAELLVLFDPTIEGKRSLRDLSWALTFCYTTPAMRRRRRSR